MPNKASIIFRLGNGDPAVARERLEMIEKQVAASDLAAGVAFVKREWDLDTSEQALSRELKKLRSEKATEQMLDKLERRRDRIKQLRKITEEGGSALSPETLQSIDQTVNDLLAALDAITGDTPADEMKRLVIDERLDRYAKIFARLTKAADIPQQTKLAIEKFRDAQRKALDRAMDELFAEVQGNKEAEELFQRFREKITATSDAEAA